MSPPGARALGPTYRIQLTPSFGFAEATALVPYLASLGIELAYLSPVAEARPGSEHGYDGVDPTRVREELGGRAGLERLASALHREGLGVLLDIVPNHLSTSPAGPWWRDVLENGRSSRYAGVFDIDWGFEAVPDARGRVILPLLGAPLAEVLAGGELSIADGGTGPVLTYGGLALPLAPGTAERGERLEEVLAVQHYLLQWWREPARNYRRFFTIDDLVGVRVEDPAVFDLTHHLIGEFVADGVVDALRVDHVDGLADPAGYLERLAALAGGRPIVVEKILTGDEPLRRSWPVSGTTGYEVADDISVALANASGLEQLAAAAAADGERPPSEVAEEAKRFVVRSSFASESARVARLTGLAVHEVDEAAVAMPVYRTYVSARGADEMDLRILGIAGGRRLRDLAADPPSAAVLEGMIRFQQLSSAAMAKGVEDTAWYRLVGKLPFLEVGGDPEAVPVADEGALARLHRRSGCRVAASEHGLVAGTTHDTKRSADVRARLLALAEMPAAFEVCLAAFADRLPARPVEDGRAPVPGPLDRRRITETCLAMAPFSGAPPQEWADVANRVEAALRKGAREAKMRDSWEEVNEAYESALAESVRALLGGSGRLLRDCFGPVLARLQRFGATLSLSEVVLRSTLPGVPDCYQGDEAWNFALVDPDNRSSVDYDRLRSMIAHLPAAGRSTPDRVARLRRQWSDGAVKLHVTRQCLAARRLAALAFAPRAAHVPLAATGLPPGAESTLVAYGRHAAGRDGAAPSAAVVLATRAPHRLSAAPGDLPVGTHAFGEASVQLPEAFAGDNGRRWRDVLSGASVDLDGGRLPVGAALGVLPVALLLPLG